MSKKVRVKLKGEVVTPGLVSLVKTFLNNHLDWDAKRLGIAAGYSSSNAQHSILSIIDPKLRRGAYVGEMRIQKSRYEGLIKAIDEYREIPATKMPKENVFPFDEQLNADKILETTNKKSKLISKTIAFVIGLEGENEDEKVQLVSILSNAYLQRKKEHA